jgi:hypothetical protein
MITVKDSLDLVYTLLSENTVYKQSFPDDADDDKFIVINTLGVPKDSIQVVEVNVNCYAKDASQEKGIPDLTTLNTMVGDVLSDIEDYHKDGVNFNLQMTNIFREKDINCHYINMRFQLTYLTN